MTAAIKEYATIELIFSANAQKLKCKEVINIKYKVHKPMKVHLIGNFDLKINISHSIIFKKVRILS